eukprot:jgi/Botrbrau1/5320/Bobra.0391s0031.1
MGTCFSCPGQAEVAFVERCGRFDRVANPGCNFVWCCIGEAIAGRLSLRVQQLDVQVDTKTKDNVFCRIVVSVQYQVIKDNLYDAFYSLTDSHSQIRSYVFDVVRAIVPKINLDDVFTTKEEIAQSVKDELTKSMTTFGFSIIQSLVTDISPDLKVRDAMNDINAAQRMRVAAAERAEANKVTVVKAAEASAEAKFLEGQGIARQRQAIVNGLRESVIDFEKEVPGVKSHDVLQLMILGQYMDTLKDIGANARTNAVFLPHSPAGLADLSSQIRDGMLAGQAVTTSSAPGLTAPAMRR